MDDTLKQLGLNKKESSFYLLLLENNDLTATEIAKLTKESRTNCYMVLENLKKLGLVREDNQKVKRYAATDPIALREIVSRKQGELRLTASQLQNALPALSSKYRLGQHKPGVVYLEGIEGLRTLLEDNARSAEAIELIASDEAFDNREAWEMLQKGAVKRASRGVTTRGLFHIANDKHWQNVKKWEKKGYQVRRWGKEALSAEIVIYGDKVAFTVYQPTLVISIMTNKALAETFKTIFNQLWEQAKA